MAAAPAVAESGSDSHAGEIASPVTGRWQADGLLPPNPQARELFAALLFALTPAAEMPGNYPQAREGDGVRVLKPHWQVIYRAPLTFSVNMPGQHLNYRVTALESSP